MLLYHTYMIIFLYLVLSLAETLCINYTKFNPKQLCRMQAKQEADAINVIKMLLQLVLLETRRSYFSRRNAQQDKACVELPGLTTMLVYYQTEQRTAQIVSPGQIHTSWIMYLTYYTNLQRIIVNWRMSLYRNEPNAYRADITGQSN